MTYLEIVRRVARLSGTVDPRSIQSTSGAGRIATISALVDEAWNEMQLMYRGWRFLALDLPPATTLTENLSVYTAESLALPSWSAWLLGEGRVRIPLTVWPAGGNRDEEQGLVSRELDFFHQSYLVGSERARRGRPQSVTVDTQDRLVVWPTPEQDYRLAGMYRRAPQRLGADGDVPIIAEEHHDAIVRAALLKLQEHDEAEPNVIILARDRADASMAAMRRRYLTGGLSLESAPVGPSSSRTGFFTSITDVPA